jgi:glycosyltransferase involved in cell wall biosynthesis
MYDAVRFAVKLLLVTQYFWPETFAINGVVRTLQANGADVTVLTGKPNYPGGDVYAGYRAWGTIRERYGAVEVLRLPIFPRGQRAPWRLAVNYLSFIVSGLFLGPWLARGRGFDLVFVYAPSPLLQAIPAVLTARLCRAPLVVWVQDLWPESLTATNSVRNRVVLGAVALVVRWIYGACNAILVQSEAFRAPVAKLAGAEAKIFYHPNSVESTTTDAAPPSKAAQALARDLQKDFSVVFAGNLGTAQSLETIVDAARRLRGRPGLRIVLVGSGSRDTWLAGEIERLGLDNLVLAGRFPPEDMPVLFEAASVLLVTLRSDPALSLTVPSKVQSYLAAGRPVVAALDGEGARIVRDSGAGVAVMPGDGVALARAIEQLQELPSSKRKAMGARGRDYFCRHFEPDMLAGRLLELFERIKAQGMETAV